MYLTLSISTLIYEHVKRKKTMTNTKPWRGSLTKAEIQKFRLPVFFLFPPERIHRQRFMGIYGCPQRQESETVAAATEYFVHGVRCMKFHGNALWLAWISLRQQPCLSGRKIKGMDVCTCLVPYWPFESTHRPNAHQYH